MTIPPWLQLALAGVFAVHGLIFLRSYLRGGRNQRHLCLVGTFAALSILYGLRGSGQPAPTIALRSVALGCTGVAVVDWYRQRKERPCRVFRLSGW
jgi:hypothetical protein